MNSSAVHISYNLAQDMTIYGFSFSIFFANKTFFIFYYRKIALRNHKEKLGTPAVAENNVLTGWNIEQATYCPY